MSNTEIIRYPPSGRNTGLNICPQGTTMVVERFGKFHKQQTAGLFVAIPLIDRIAYVHDMRERAIRVEPQEAISKDNVTVRLGGTVYLQIVDAVKASYAASKPMYAVVQHAQSALRAAVGLMDLDELFHGRDKLNATVRSAIEEASTGWSIKILRFEILELLPDDRVRQAMDLQAVAERERREEILRAEATKRSMELKSEGKRTQETNESEGLKIRLTNEGAGEKARTIAASEADAAAILNRATATANAISIIAESLKQPNGDKAISFQLAKDYFRAFSSLAGSSNTMIIPANVGDMAGMIGAGASVLETVRKSMADLARSPSSDSQMPPSSAELIPTIQQRIGRKLTPSEIEQVIGLATTSKTGLADKYIVSDDPAIQEAAEARYAAAYKIASDAFPMMMSDDQVIRKAAKMRAEIAYKFAKQQLSKMNADDNRFYEKRMKWIAGGMIDQEPMRG